MAVTTRGYPREAATAWVKLSDILVGLLGLLTFLGAGAGIWRLFVGMGPTTDLSNTYPWGIWIGFDFTLIAFSGAAFTIATVVYVFRLKKYEPVATPAVMAGLLGYVAVLLLLVLDLGRWDRFYHFIIYWNVHSPLFEISWCVLLYSTVLFIENSSLAFDFFGKEKWSHLVHRFVVPISIVGLTLSSLHQSTLGTLYLNMPHRLDALWYSPILSVLFFVSSVMAGLSLGMVAYILAARIRDEEVDNDVVSGLAKGVAIVTGLYVLLKLGDMYLAGELPALLALDGMSWLMWLELGLGAIVPLILFLVPALRAQRRVQWTGALLVLFGVLMNRFSATLFAQQPLGTETYSPHILEWLSTIGIIAAAMLIWYLGMRYVVKPADHAHS